jgi:hypothetical protein
VAQGVHRVTVSTLSAQGNAVALPRDASVTAAPQPITMRRHSDIWGHNGRDPDLDQKALP